MARRKRMTKAEAGAFGFFILVALILAAIAAVIRGIAEFLQSLGLVGSTALLIAIAGICWYAVHLKNESNRARQTAEQQRLAEEQHRREAEKIKRLAYLNEKYNDPDIAERILSKKIWQGQTTEQLRDSLGAPIDIDENVLKTKIKEVWKYHSMGGNRYGLRIKLENGFVIGWDEKL